MNTLQNKNEFAIAAKTCTLKHNKQSGGSILLDGTTHYVIPIYQRPYSWDEEQIKKFIGDIFMSYWGNERKVQKDSIFIGTMQLTARNGNEHHVIDGQQRLSTLLVLLKLIKHLYPENKAAQEISLNWLSTQVNKGVQQAYLEEFLNSEVWPCDTILNPYQKNALLIKELLDEELQDEEGSFAEFDAEDFLTHIYCNIYFVVIETKAGITKTLQIFNAINTTGLDLNGGDIFKLRMYEYLEKKGNIQNAFDAISSLYEKIDTYNKKAGYSVMSINEILGYYQYVIIAKYNLPDALFYYATDTFYEQLFNAIFNNQSWPPFKNNISHVELSLSDLDGLIEARYDWEFNWYVTAEDMCCYHLMGHSRYGKYADVLPVILIYSNINCNRFSFVKQLAKLYFIYSVRFQKSIYEIHNWTYDLIKEIVKGNTADNIMLRINDKIGNEEIHNQGYYDLNFFISENLTENFKRKNLICRLSAMLEEDYTTTAKEKIASLKTILWKKPIDIEHIQPIYNSNMELRDDILEDWQNDIHSIGNLIILEEAINRSISNSPYPTKIKAYHDSAFSIVQKQIKTYPEWTLENCQERKQSETKKILRYLFD